MRLFHAVFSRDPKSQLAWSKREEIFKLASDGELEQLQQLLDSGAAQQAKDGVKYLVQLLIVHMYLAALEVVLSF